MNTRYRCWWLMPRLFWIRKDYFATSCSTYPPIPSFIHCLPFLFIFVFQIVRKWRHPKQSFLHHPHKPSSGLDGNGICLSETKRTGPTLHCTTSKKILFWTWIWKVYGIAVRWGEGPCAKERRSWLESVSGFVARRNGCQNMGLFGRVIGPLTKCH